MAKSDRSDDRSRGQKGLLEPDRGAAARPSRGFGGSGERQPVPRQPEGPGDDKCRDHEPHRRFGQRGVIPTVSARPSAIQRKSTMRRCRRSDRRPDEDARDASENLRGGERSGRHTGGDSALVVEEEHEEPEQAELCRDVERARDTDPPHARVAEWAGLRANGRPAGSARMSTRADDCGHDATDREAVERRVQADVRLKRGESERCDRAAERHRHLSDAEGEACAPPRRTRP